MPGAGDSTWRTWRHTLQGLGLIGLPRAFMVKIRILWFYRGFLEFFGLFGSFGLLGV